MCVNLPPRRPPKTLTHYYSTTTCTTSYSLKEQRTIKKIVWLKIQRKRKIVGCGGLQEVVVSACISTREVGSGVEHWECIPYQPTNHLHAVPTSRSFFTSWNLPVEILYPTTSLSILNFHTMDSMNIQILLNGMNQWINVILTLPGDEILLCVKTEEVPSLTLRIESNCFMAG